MGAPPDTGKVSQAGGSVLAHLPSRCAVDLLSRLTGEPMRLARRSPRRKK
jgi:hypothetical protein